MMDDSIFDVSEGGNSDFEPGVVSQRPAVSTPIADRYQKAKVIKTKAAAKKATTSKPAATKKAAAPKAKAAPKPKSTVPKKRTKKDAENEDPESDDDAFDDESLLADTPPKAKKQKVDASSVKGSHKKPLGDLVNEQISKDPDSPQAKKKTKRTSEQYQKLTQLEHIIKRPDTYIGSIEFDQRQSWIYNSTSDSMEFKEISFVPGIFKIFDEILVNAADNKQNDKNQDEIRVVIDREKGQISVWNNGRGIPVEIHSKEKIYIPEMIFGHLLTGSNYDDDEQKVTGGRNGYGAKLTNIFSTSFTLETASSKNKKKYKQTWTENMSKMGEAKITDCKGEDYTQITFRPDFAKFHMTDMDDDLEGLFKRRVYDLAGTLKGVKVSLNGKRISARKFSQYIELYTKGIKRERGEEAANDKSEIIVESPDPRWEVGFAVSDGSFQQVSFVNSISTTSGGSHVNHVADQIVLKLLDVVKKKNKGGAQLKPNQIRNHLFLFVNALVVNPAFTSQTKEQLTTKPSAFGSKCPISDDFIKKITSKTEVITNILAFAQQKADQILKKTDGNKRSRMTNPKLTDANKAGTKDGHLCTLILTEGDSARGLAMAGRSVVGPDLFGVFPLRGKLLNVRDASIDQISKNSEIQNIKTFLGLQHKKNYEDTKGLRYGHLMIMTDQDHDGSHIKGLLINFLQVQFPSLLKLPEFLVEFITPIIKVWKGDPKHPSQSRGFFTMPEYHAWQEAHKADKGWEHKYFKGLGTSSTEDAQEYFNDLDKHHKEFNPMKEEEAGLIELAFSKKKADERKEWLRQFKPGTFLDHAVKKISYTDFINKELILFSMADNIRSIPSVVDGLKPGQRKVLYTCFKRNLKKDIKVVELAGLVSGLTAYQHGETSLQMTIVGLAQTFVGSNNINCLEPSGNFGSRLQGGSDAASARYIYTRLSPFARKLFHQADEPLLTYNLDDDKTIEPEVYAPIVPMILINGTDGIGTGWSSSIPNYNPQDIVDNLKRKMEGSEWTPMQPWFRGFKGEVTDMGSDRYRFSGIIKQSDEKENEIEITELPVRLWTQDFKDKLEEIIKAEKIPSFIKDYKDYNTHKDVHFVIQMEEKYMKAALTEGLEEKFKLTRSIATSNLVAFDPEGRITKYANVEAILDEFYSYRLQLYAKRKAWMIDTMNKDLRKLSNQARFIKMIIDQKLVISKKKKAILIGELKKLGFDPFPKKQDTTKQAEVDPEAEEEDEDKDVSSDASAYDYLLGMALWSLTEERVERLLKQIGEKELEVDALMKKSKEDLWKADLDDFIAEWHFQLEDEKQRQKGIRKGRRVSKKFATARPTVKKRKGLGDASDDDDDFEVKVPKKSAPAPKPRKVIQTKLTYVSPKVTGTKNVSRGALYTDGSSDPVSSRDETPASTAESRPVAGSRPASQKPILKAESDSDEVISKPVNRTARTAVKKAAYTIDSDSDSDNGDGLLADLGNMVKGLPSKSEETILDNRPLFTASASRPSSSHDFKSLSRPVMKPSDNMSDDETDYKSLAPPASPRRSILVTKLDDTRMDLSDDDSDLKPVKATKPVKKAIASKPKKDTVADAKVKKPAAKKAAPAKKAEQSPVAKAYAKRLAKKKAQDDDEDDEMMDDLLDSPGGSDSGSPAPKAAPRLARRAVAAKKPAVKYDFDDSEEEDAGGYSDEASENFSDDG